MRYFKSIFLLLSLTQILFSQELHRTGALENDPRMIPELTQVTSIPLVSRAAPLAAVDLSSQMPPVGNQGGQGSCVAWAMGYYHKTHTEWREQGWDVYNTQNQFSPAFIYNHINGGRDGGAYFSDAMKAIVDLGAPSMALMPYNQSNYTTWPADTVYSYATRYRGASGYYIDCGNDQGLDLIKAQLNNGYTVVLGIRVYSNFDYIGNFENTYCAIDRYGTNRGGHGVTIVGYDDDRVTHDGTGAFKLVNSWGTGWGTAGYFWMSYQGVKDSYISQRTAYYVTDRIGYNPSLKAYVRITHNARTRISIRFGFGPTSSPRATKDFFNWSMGTGTNQSFPANNIVFDLSDNIGSLSPDSKVFLRCYDNTSDALAGTINYYAAEFVGSYSRISPDPPVTIPDQGTYVYAQMPEPVFSVSSPVINYEEVSVFTGKQDSVVVSNTGIGALTIISAASDNSKFAVNPTSGVITSGSSQTFYITFNPDSNGPDSGSIMFNHDAPGSPDTVTVEGHGVTPEFRVSPVHIAYGNIPIGSSKTDSVTVTNTGNGTLNISGVASTDSTFIVTPTSVSIPPSDSIKFYITFVPNSAETRQGDIHFFHDAEELHTVISMDGIGIAPLFTISPIQINFGDLPVGSTMQDTVTVTNTGFSTINIYDVSSSDPDFTALPATADIPASDSAIFIITFMPTSGGEKNSDIIFLHNALSSPDTVTAEGNGLAPIFSADPMHISFGDLFVGSTKLDSVTVTNTGNSILNISSITSSDPDFTVSPSSGNIPVAGSEKFYVTFMPATAGEKTCNIIFMHDAESSPDTVIANGKGVAPLFAVSPAEVSYGDVHVGSMKQDSVTVNNNGNYPLIISGVSSLGPDFMVTPASANIPPAGSEKFYITFAPTAIGENNSNIIFTHNALGSPDTITAEGTGIDPVFSVSRTNISFGDLLVSSTKEDTVTVFNTGNSVLNISGVLSLHTDFTVAPASAIIPAPGSAAFLITFLPSSIGTKNGAVIFTHNALGSPDTLTVSGIGRQAIFYASPVHISFGDIYVDSVKRDSVMVYNNGNSDLDIAAVASTDGEFLVTPYSAVIPASDSARFYISFAPLSVGVNSGFIIFEHNGSGSPDTVTVDGSGKEPPANPVPVITTISPSSKIAGDTAFTLSVNGSNFNDLSVVRFNGIDRHTTCVDSTHLAASIPAIEIAVAGIYPITVYNPSPGGGISNVLIFNVYNPLPDQVVLASPPNNTSTGINSVILSWHTGQPQITKYWVEWSKDSLFSSPEIDTSATDTFRVTADLNEPQEYWWRVKAGNMTGWGPFSEVWKFTVIITEAVDEENIPQKFSISQNYPNPFNPVTVIEYDIPEESDVLIIVYDILGQEVATLVNEHKEPGSYKINWTAGNLSSGVYIYRIQAGKFVMIKKLILAR